MPPRGSIYVLTGERGTGKTLVCAQLVASARARGLDVAGILTGRSGPDPGDARQVVDVRSGESRPFGAHASLAETGASPRPRPLRGAAASTPGAAAAPAGRTSSDPLTPGWEYETEMFAWANQVLARAAPCDLLIVDEMGPLELEGGRGWAEALVVLRARDFGAALVVCRPSLLGELESSLGGPPARVFEAHLDTSDALAGTILEEVVG